MPLLRSLDTNSTSTHPGGGSSSPGAIPRHGQAAVSFARTLICTAFAALALAGNASADLQIGVADDLGFHADTSSWFFDSLGELGMRENRVTVPFDASAPDTIQSRAALDLY